MQNDKPIDPRVSDFFVEKGTKSRLLEKLVAQKYPEAQFESIWPKLVASLSFFLASEVLKVLSEEGKKTILEKAPGTTDLQDLSVFSEYFLAMIEEAKKWPNEKQETILNEGVDGVTKQVMEGYQSVLKHG